MSKTSLALGNLRGFAILMVLAFHSCIAYMSSQPASPPAFDVPPYGWLANPIIDSSRWIGLDLFCAFQYVYLMHLMFFLSGLFVWSSLVRKGWKTFLYDRFKRLGIPFLVGIYVLMPVAYYPVYRVTASDSSWAAYWSHLMALPFSPSGPMWFLWLLLAFNLVVVALYVFASRVGEFMARVSADSARSPGRYVAVVIGLSAIAYVPLASVFKPWQWVEFGPFALQPSFVLPYAIFFLAGIGLGAAGLERGPLAPDGLLPRHWIAWVAGAPAAFLLWIIPTALIVNGPGSTLPGLQVLANLGSVVSSATSSFALIAVFLRFGANRRPILGGLSEHAYGIYLFHYVFLIWLQYLLLDLGLHAIVKAAIVFAGTLALSWPAAAAMSRVPFGMGLARVKRRASA